MNHRIGFVLPLILTGCGSPPPEPAAPPSPTAGPASAAAPTPPPEPAPSSEAPKAEATKDAPKGLSPEELAAFCSESCERNGKLCAEIDVPRCTKNCETAFGAVADFCPGRLGAFVECIRKDPLRCKAGAKIRAQGCDEQSDALTMCLGLHSVPESDRCVMQCKEFGQCEIVDGVCTATPESCAKLEQCQAKGCKVVNALCEPNG